MLNIHFARLKMLLVKIRHYALQLFHFLRDTEKSLMFTDISDMESIHYIISKLTNRKINLLFVYKTTTFFFNQIFSIT